jgi:hypothetical protein
MGRLQEARRSSRATPLSSRWPSPTAAGARVSAGYCKATREETERVARVFGRRQGFLKTPGRRRPSSRTLGLQRWIGRRGKLHRAAFELGEDDDLLQIGKLGRTVSWAKLLGFVQVGCDPVSSLPFFLLIIPFSFCFADLKTLIWIHLLFAGICIYDFTQNTPDILLVQNVVLKEFLMCITQILVGVLL